MWYLWYKRRNFLQNIEYECSWTENQHSCDSAMVLSFTHPHVIPNLYDLLSYNYNNVNTGNSKNRWSANNKISEKLKQNQTLIFFFSLQQSGVSSI